MVNIGELFAASVSDINFIPKGFDVTPSPNHGVTQKP